MLQCTAFRCSYLVAMPESIAIACDRANGCHYTRSPRAKMFGDQVMTGWEAVAIHEQKYFAAGYRSTTISRSGATAVSWKSQQRDVIANVCLDPVR